MVSVNSTGGGPTHLHARPRGPWPAAFLFGGATILALFYNSGVRWGVLAAAMVMALAPLAVLLLCVHVTQNHRPEPAAAMRWALGWGAFVSTAIAVRVNTVVGTDIIALVFSAPVLEEALKAGGLILLARVGRIKNPLDGVVYATLIGAGFAFTENVMYFVPAVDEGLAGGGSASLLGVLWARGVVSLFAHPTFTVAAGASLGYAYGKPSRDLLPLAGFAGSVALHASWNYAAVTSLLADNLLLTRVLFIIPGSLIVGALIKERRIVRTNMNTLTEESRALLGPVRGRTGLERADAEIRRREAYRLLAKRDLPTTLPGADVPTGSAAQRRAWASEQSWYAPAKDIDAQKATTMTTRAEDAR